MCFNFFARKSFCEGFKATTYSFDGRKLQEAIFETLQNRGTSYDSSTLIDVSRLTEDPGMLTKWRYFSKSTIKTSVEFGDVINVIKKFVGTPFEAIIHETELLREWNPKLLCYEPYK